jgi:predicted acyltransferase
MTFSFARRLEQGDKRQLLRSVLRRSLIILLLGLFLSALPYFDLANLRYVGVLQRIAVVYLAASLIVLNLSRRAQAWVTLGLLLGYWAVMKLVPVPGVGAGVLTPEGNLAAWIDQFVVPGRMYQGTWDPEGFLSTFPAIATTLLGVFTGHWIRSGRERLEIVAGMFAIGWLAILAGLAWGIFFPINKHLWTSSYVIFTAGAALELLALFYWLIDIQGYQRWARPAVVFGVNAIAVFVLSGTVSRFLNFVQVPSGAETIPAKQWIYDNLFATWASPINASFGYAVCHVLMWWALMTLLYRREIFIKI